MMNETVSIDTAIQQVERLYRSVTGQSVPPVGEQPYATIPPEKVPEEHVQEQVDRLVETLAEFSLAGRTEVAWRPPISLWEGTNEVVVRVEVPGTTREAIHVALNRGVLEVQGTRPIQTDREGELSLKYVEHPYGKFRRVIPLPSAARTEQLQANLRDGVLEIRIPKDPGRSEKPRHVPIA